MASLGRQHIVAHGAGTTVNVIDVNGTPRTAPCARSGRINDICAGHP